MIAREPNYVTPAFEQQLRRGATITPSAINPWYGNWAEGSLYTRQQLHQLKMLGLDPDTVDHLDVHVKVTAKEAWWPTTKTTPIRRIPCPVVGHRLDRIKVVSPAGHVKLVYAGGHIVRPKPQRQPRGIRA